MEGVKVDHKYAGSNKIVLGRNQSRYRVCQLNYDRHEKLKSRIELAGSMKNVLYGIQNRFVICRFNQDPADIGVKVLGKDVVEVADFCTTDISTTPNS